MIVPLGSKGAGQEPGKARSYAIATVWLVFMAMFLLSGCQSTPPTDEQKLQNNDGQDLPVGEAVGSGPTKVLFFVHQTGKLADTGASNALINGAKMAVNDLGADHITLIIENTNSDLDRMTQLAAANSTAALLVASNGAGIVKAVRKSGDGAARPVIALDQYRNSPSTDSGSPIYWFRPGWIIELAAAVEFASRATGGKPSVALVFPNDAPSEEIKRLNALIVPHIGSAEVVRHRPGAAFSGLGKKAGQILEQADVVVMAGSGNDVVGIVGGIRNNTGDGARKHIVVRSDFAKRMAAESALEGSITAIPDTRGLEVLKDRYEKSYSAPMTMDSAYAYDAVAIAAGLVRAKGEGSITKSNLETSIGFGGASGKFRFRSDGQVERLCAIVSVSDGQLKTISAVPNGF